MPNHRLRVPKPSRHATGQAVVRLTDRATGQVKDYYVGRWGSPEAQCQYDRKIAEWLANGRRLPGVPATPDGPSVNRLILAYLEHARRYYVKDGRQTDELHCIKSALKPVQGLYGSEPAAELSPLRLKAVREQMIGSGWSRKYVNASVSRIKRMFRWGVENELVPSAVFEALRAVQGLQAGRSAARETERRRPVPTEHIEAVKAVVKPEVCDLIELQLLCGARPSELLNLTTAAIDRSRPVWIAALEGHKCEHFGKSRVLFFGPRAQLILQRYLKADREARLFTYDRRRYREAVRYACKKLSIPRWTPYWLRHTCATAVRENFGAEGAQTILGHSNLSTTELYAQKSVKLGMEIAAKVG